MTFAQEPATGAGDRAAPRPAALPASLEAACRERKHDFLGIGLSCQSDEELVDLVGQAVRARSRLTVSFVNSEYVLQAHRIAGLMEKINRFDVVLPDGWTVVYGGRWLGVPVPNRQANDDISPSLFALSEESTGSPTSCSAARRAPRSARRRPSSQRSPACPSRARCTATGT